MIDFRKLVYGLAHSAAVFWLLLALLTFGGIALSTLGWIINVIMGIIFVFIGLFFWVRGRALKLLLEDVDWTQSGRFLQSEVLLLAGVNLVTLILLSAAVSRVFGERLPIFG